MNDDIAYVEEKLGHRMTDTERSRFMQLAKIAPRLVPKSAGFIAGDDPVEMRPVRRLSFASGHSLPGVKGGQLRTGADLERDAKTMGWAVAICAAVPIGICIAKALAAASIWIGENYAVHLFI